MQISREHPLMIFQMGQQLMIEHIRKGEVGKALQYGQEFLAPLALTNVIILFDKFPASLALLSHGMYKRLIFSSY